MGCTGKPRRTRHSAGTCEAPGPLSSAAVRPAWERSAPEREGRAGESRRFLQWAWTEVSRRGKTPRRDSRPLQPRRPAQLAEIPVERAQRQLAGFSRKFEEEAVRETECGSPPKCLEGRRDGLRLLKREALTVQERLNRPSDLSRVAVVDGREHSRGFGEGARRKTASSRSTHLSSFVRSPNSRLQRRPFDRLRVVPRNVEGRRWHRRHGCVKSR
jgi:hypothetical protein